MRRKVLPIFFDSVEDLHLNISKVSDQFSELGIVCVRGIRLDRSAQFAFSKKLGDVLGWFPNSVNETWDHQWEEGHSSVSKVSQGPDEIIIDWHLEHVDYDPFCPMVAAMWNMWNFKSKPGSGNTMFVDSSEVYQLLSDQDKDFLNGCNVEWLTSHGDGPHESLAVRKHWIHQNPVIRVDITERAKVRLKSLHGSKPTSLDQQRFLTIMSFVIENIHNNLDIRYVHSWQEGDILIPDLQKMAHTVCGGFNIGDRTFTNFWSFLRNPQALSPEETPKAWR